MIFQPNMQRRQPTSAHLGLLTKFTSTASTATAIPIAVTLTTPRPATRSDQTTWSLVRSRNQGLQRRYQLLHTVGDLLPNSRTATCMQRLIPGKTGVNLVHLPGEPHARVHNVQRCGNVWTCPFCAAITSQRRRDELTRELAHKGYRVVMVTFTLHHHRGQRLAEVLNHIQTVYDNFTKGRAYQDFKRDFHILGTITTKDIRYHLRYGWHPHLHVLLVHKEKPADLDPMATAIKQRWLAAAKQHGHYVHPDYATKLSPQNDHLIAYVTKHGQLPNQSEPDILASLTQTTPASHDQSGYTPFELLELAAAGDADAGERFKEYAQATRGKQMMRYSKNLKQLLGIRPKSDQQMAQQDDDRDDGRIIITLPPLQWKAICRAHKQAQVLIYAVQLPLPAFKRYLEQFQPQPTKQGRPRPSP